MATLDVTTLARVKGAMPHATTVNDARIAELIVAVSDYVETGLARWLKIARTTEVYVVQPSERIVWLRGMPITTVHSARYAARRKFTDVDALDSAEDFDLHAELGQIELRIPLTGTPGYLQVDYEGGMAADTAGFVSAYGDIAEAATLEVVNRLQRSGNPEGEVRGFESGITYKTGQLGVLKALDQAIATYRRRVL